MGKVRSKKLFPETTTDKIFEKNSSFRGNYHIQSSPCSSNDEVEFLEENRYFL